MRNHVRRFDDGGSIWGSDDSDGLSVNVDSDSPENNPYVGTNPTGDELNPYRQPVDNTDELNPYVPPKTGPVEDELNPYRQPPGVVGGGGGGGGGGGTPQTPAPTIPAELKNFFKGLIVGDDGKPNPMGLFGLMALLTSMRGSGAPAAVGYQGGVPKYTAVRERVPTPVDPNRRPGSGGRRYFSDTQYIPTPSSPTDTSVQTARAAAQEQAKKLTPAITTVPISQDKKDDAITMGPPAPEKKESSISDLMDRVKAANPGLDWSKYNPGKMTMDYDEFDQARDTFLRNMSGARGQASDRGKSIGATGGLSSVLGMLGGRSDAGLVKPSTSYGDTPEDFGYTDQQFADMLLRQSTLPPPPRPVEPGVQMAAQGGLMNLARGRYLNGSTDGMADKIPANIEGTQPARLSHGEFVIPADVVSHLGNGNSESGAQRLYDMMDRIRKARTGTSKQGKQINPDKFMPR